jgi:hypothetical protein
LLSRLKILKGQSKCVTMYMYVQLKYAGCETPRCILCYVLRYIYYVYFKCKKLFQESVHLQLKFRYYFLWHNRS